MGERLLKWLFFSVGLTFIQVLLSIVLCFLLNLEIEMNNYISELLFMAVTLSATSLGDVFALNQKGVKGIPITLLFLVLIFLILSSSAIYNFSIMKDALSDALKNSINDKKLFELTLWMCGLSAFFGVICQIYLEHVENSREQES